MARFGARSRANLAECHADLQHLFAAVIDHVDCAVIEGHRPRLAQDAAYHAGKSKLEWPASKHNKTPSLAADVVPYPVDWKDTERFYWFGGFALGLAAGLHDQGAMTHRIRWGGDWDGDRTWKDQAFHDLPHFELIER